MNIPTEFTTLAPIGEIYWCRSLFEPYLKGSVLDVGFGCCPVVPHAICMDRAEGHVDRGLIVADFPTHLVGDARHLYWFADGVLDAVSSSHCLEDFTLEETVPVLAEWLRVIKPGGYLCLFLPDQKTYVAYCNSRNELPNGSHKIADFNIDYVKGCLAQLPVEIVEAVWPFPGNPYSFAIVARKL